MTTPTPNLLAFELDLAAVFTAHGFDPHTVQISAAPMYHGDELAGVTVSAFSYVRPEGVPAPRPEAAGDPFAAAAEQVEATA
jgi:hypothetical protein